MKSFSFIIVCMTAALFFSTSAFSQDAKTPGSSAISGKISVMSGKVTQVLKGGGYTYALVEYVGGKVWMAMPETKLKVGENTTFYSGMEMQNFKSESLSRTFDRIIFTPGPVILPGTDGNKANETPATSEKIKVEEAKGTEAHTIAEVYQDKAALAGKTVSVRGKVVKVSKDIMDKNWLHIEDGTGTSGSNSLIVLTTDDKAAVGDVITATGTITPDKDFGYGYKYDVIMEQAEIKK
ncbi:MAG: DNA-binding protein [Nitrospirota bacterium]